MQSNEAARIANLAKLGANTDELAQYAQELTAILAMVERMGEIDTSAVEPLAHPLELSQRLRPDLITEEDRREQLQRIAPQTQAGFYLVPRVIE